MSSYYGGHWAASLVKLKLVTNAQNALRVKVKLSKKGNGHCGGSDSKL